MGTSMPDVRRDNNQDRGRDLSKTATLDAGRDLVQLGQECSAAKEQAKTAAASNGDPARLAALQERHQSFERELDRRAGNAQQKQELAQARTAVQDLEQQEISQLKTSADVAAKAYGSMAQSIERVQQAQRRDQEALTNRPGAAAADLQRLAEHQADQTRDLQKTVGDYSQALREHESAQANAMADTEDQLIQATLGQRENDAGLSRADLINKVVADAARKADEQQADLRGTVRNFENQLREIEARLAPDARQNVRDELKDTALADLGDRAIDRVVAAAREGQQRRQAMDADQSKRSELSALNRVKGQLMEEAFRALAQAEARELSQKLGKNVEFIDGNRIRDAQGKKLSDGMLAWKDDAGRLRVERAYEAKAGENAARGLNEAIEKLTRAAMRETQKYAEDMALEAYQEQHGKDPNLRFANATAEQRKALDALKESALKELLSPNAQRDMGQLERTIERLHESVDSPTRVYVDGKPRTLAVNQGRTDMKAVLPQDVALEEHQNAMRVAIRAEDLQKASERLLERLKRDQLWE